eukprot:SAG11_NODE_9910_length_870_cov_1.989624_1_plen_92_part_00
MQYSDTDSSDSSDSFLRVLKTRPRQTAVETPIARDTDGPHRVKITVSIEALDRVLEIHVIPGSTVASLKTKLRTELKGITRILNRSDAVHN